MVLCTNCHIDIDESKIILHQRFCFQNIKYCDKCKEGFPIEEFDEHLSSHLTKKSSSNLSDDELKLKKKLSLKRLESSKIGCQYCGLYLSYSEIEEHEQMCGARTHQCPFCEKYITNKDMENHKETEHKGMVEDETLKKKTSVQLTEDELIQKAVEESLKESNPPPQTKEETKKKEILKKKSTAINMDDIDYDYLAKLEEEMYEDNYQDDGNEQ